MRALILAGALLAVVFVADFALNDGREVRRIQDAFADRMVSVIN
jgi:hypothetical protein